MTARSGRLAWLVLPFVHLVAASSWARDVHDVLGAVAFEAQAPRPLRAEVRIEPDGAPPLDAVLLEDGSRRYLETRTGVRALLSPGKVLVARDGAVVPAESGAALAGDILLEDLAPFGNRAIDVPQVSDESPMGTVVTAAPRPPSVYVLLVHTIDPDRPVIVRTKYYRDTINNLVKMARFDDFAAVGGRWRPGVMTVETFRPAPRTTRVTFRWREAPETPPALFTPAGLRAPSPIRWP